MKENKNTRSENLPQAENPTRFTGLQLSLPHESAAGLTAVFTSVKHVMSEMGPFRAWHALNTLNQKDGYDCPGCAWPDPDGDRSRLGEYCENGVKAIAEEATTKILDEYFFAEHSVAELSELTDYEIGKKGRIAQPVFLPKNGTHYVPVSWDDAFGKIAGHLQKCHPDEGVFYTSGRTSNEAAFLYQLFVREYGTNNLPDCSNMCHESSGVALTESLGIGKGSVTLDDFYKAEVILILGQNPGTNHPRMLSALQKAKENNCIIISINPIPEAGLLSFTDPQRVSGVMGKKTKLTDYFLPVKINGDMALLQAIEKILMEEDEKDPGKVLDRNFIESNTSGFGDFAVHIRNSNLQKLSDACGIPVETIRTIAGVLKNKSRIIACWAMGLTQHKNAVDSIKEIVNLLLLKGSIGKPGAGTCPVRGHSNVQGDRTMGIYEKPSSAFIDSLEKNFQKKFPREPGYDTVESIHAMKEGKVKVFIAMGGNFLSATPDTNYTAEALRNCELTVQISTKLNRSHLVTGKEALILPAMGRSDKDMLNGEQQFVTTENSMGVVQMSKGSLRNVSEDLLSEPVIVCRLAKSVFGENVAPRWDKYLQHYDHIRDDISKVIPGFDNYNERVRKAGGFYLPNPARDGRFRTLTGKAEFNVAVPEILPLEKGEFLMMTIRSHDQFNTTIYGLNDRYRGVMNERRVIFMNESDMTESGFTKLQVVDLYNYHDGRERVCRRFRVIPYPIPKGCTATYFPETNVLVPVGVTAGKSNTPVSKSVVIRVKPGIE